MLCSRRLTRLVALLPLLSWLALPLSGFSAESEASKSAVAFTAAEKEWLARHPVIRVAPDPSFAPIEFVDASGAYRGIAADVLDTLGARLGVRFTPIHVESWEDALEKVRNREADLLARAARTPEREEYMSFSRGYLELPGSIIARTTSSGVTRLADLKGRKVAVVSGYIWQSLLSADHPEIVLVPAESMDQALAKVSDGSVDALIANPVSATYYIRRSGNTALTLVGETGYKVRYSLAVRKDWPELKGILDKVRASISGDDVQEILDQWLDEVTATITPGGVSVQVGSITREMVVARIADLEADETLDANIRSKALEYYRQAKSHLEGEAAANGQVATYKRIARTAASETERLREQLRALSARKPADAAATLPLSLEDLEQEAAKQQAEVRTLRGSLAELVEQTAREQARPGKIRSEIKLENERIAATSATSKAAPPAGEHPAVTAARMASSEAATQAHAATVRQLEQELLSHGARLNLLRARRDLLNGRLAGAEARLAKLEELVNQRRATEAALVRQAMETARRQAIGKHPAVRGVAVENARLSARLSSLAAQIADVTRDKERVKLDSREIEQAFQYAREKLEIAGLSNVLGEALRTQREMLPNVERYQRSAAERDQQLGEARLGQLSIDQQRLSLRDISTRVDQLLGSATATLSEQEREAVEAELAKLLEDQREILSKLWQSYGKHVDELQGLGLAEKNLLTTAERYADLLDKELLWLASTQPIGQKWLTEVWESLLWLVSVRNWEEVGRALVAGGIAYSLPMALVLTVFGILLAGRPGLRRQAERISANVGGFANDSYLLTVQAMFIVLLYVLPWPLLLYAISSLAGLSNPTAFTAGVAVGLAEVALILFFLSFFRQVCRDDGIARTHFQWSRRVTELFWRNLGWLLVVLLPLEFLISLTESQPNELHRDALGRVAFAALSIAQIVFAWRVLHPRYGVLSEPAAGGQRGWQQYTKYLLLLVGTGLPLLFGFLAIVGYYYTAVRLEGDLLESLQVIGAGVLLYSLFERWLVVAQRRLTRARVRAGRKALEAAKRAGQSAPEAVADVPNILEVNLVSMNDQIRRLVGLLIGGLVLVPLWLVWSDVMPALAILDEVTLWHSRAVDGGVENLAPVTLGDLGWALVIALLTLMAGRNLPGLLEMGLLDRLHVTPGTLYAISTLSRYAIITIGIIASFRLIGIGWAQVQWLAAAVGVGLGFGLREIFASFIAGLIILFERPVRVGDIVTLGTVNGTVTRIRIRATTITDWDNKETVVPNNILVTQELTNWTLSNEVVRAVVKVGIAHGSDTDLAEEVMMKVAKQHPLVLEEPPPSVLFLGFGEHRLDFEVRVFTRDQGQRLTMLHELHKTLERALREHGIEIALPKLDVRVQPELSEAEPKPDRQRIFGA